MVLVTSGVRSRIDKAGHMVIPKALRAQLGLRPGEVDVTADGAALRIVPVHDDALVEADGRLLIPESGIRIDDELVQELRGIDRCSCGRA
jgi:AbrB family looped-hinge helix DNA binding protein